MIRLLLGNKYWYPKGGTETYLFELVEELPSLGYEVIPFSMKHPDNRDCVYAEYFVDQVDYGEREGFFRDFRKARRILYSAHARNQLERLLSRARPDLAHLHNIYHQISPSILPVLRRRGIPVVMTLHDLKLACPNYKMRTQGRICERCVKGGYHNAVLKRCVRDSYVASALCAAEAALHRATGIYLDNVSKFIVPSQFYVSKMRASGIPEEKLVCVPSFTHVERYVPAYGASDYCVYVGRLSDEKGIPTLLEAMRGFDRGRLLIIGEGPLRPALEEFVARHQLRNVEVLGSRTGEELQALMRGATFSVIPSEWYENCPRAGIESLACGTPVIAADIGGVPEMIEDGRTGLLFQPFSVADLQKKMTYLFDHEQLVVEMGKNARRKAERDYSLRAHLERLLPVYAEAMGRS